MNAILAAITSRAAAPAEAADPLSGLRDNAAAVAVPWPAWVWWTIIGGSIVLLALLAWFVVWYVKKPERKSRHRHPGRLPGARSTRFTPRRTVRNRTSSASPCPTCCGHTSAVNSALHATQQTSPEFLASIAGSPQFTGEDRALLAAFLERCDLLKFARVEARSAENYELLRAAAAFVEGRRVDSTVMNDRAFSFAQPWLLLLLLVPLALAWMLGGRGAMPVIRYSSLAALRPVGHAARARIRRHRAGARFACTRYAHRRHRTAAPRQAARRDRIIRCGHRADAGRLAFDARGGFYAGRPPANRLEAVKEVTRRFIRAVRMIA